MSIEVISIIALLFIFIFGSLLSINVGILGFVASFLIYLFYGGITLDDIYSSFPADIFILLVGVTYLFSIVQHNGTINLITHWGLSLVRGNVGLIPWVILFICAMLTSFGVAALAVCSIIAPIAMRMAFDFKINPLLMALMLHLGIAIGGFSPLNIFGIIVGGIMQSENIPFSPVALYINIAIFVTVASFIAFVLLGGIRLLKDTTIVSNQVAVTSEAEISTASSQNKKINFYQITTLICILSLVVLVVYFKLNMGFAALTLGLLLALMDLKNQGEVLKKIPWSIILLVAGIITYVGVLDKIGTIAFVTTLIAEVGNPVLASLVASYLGGFISIFASTTGFLAAIIPLSVPILNDPAISTMGVVSAIAISANIVDLSPLSGGGALMLANVQGLSERVFFRNLLFTTAILALIGPGLAWLIFIVLDISF